MNMNELPIIPAPLRNMTVLTVAFCVCSVMAGLVLVGCWESPFLAGNVAGLETFNSPEAFKQYLAEQVHARRTTGFGPWGYGGGGQGTSFPMPTGDVVVDAVPAPMMAPDMDMAPLAQGYSAGTGDYSTTNIQEEGVDEGDVVKNDADYLYILNADQGPQGRLRIIRAVPVDDMEIVSTVTLPGTPSSLYLRGDTLVALGRSSGDTIVTVLDVTDRGVPIIVATVELEGGLMTSRLIGSSLHLVVQANPTLPSTDDEAAILNANYDDLVPALSVTDAKQRTTTRTLVEWQSFYRPFNPDGYHITAVVTLNVDHPSEPVRSVGVMGDAGTIYASLEALYVTDGTYDNLGNMREITDIYKFALNDDGATLVGVGSIPGRLLNRFSLGEHRGYLRAATTTDHVRRGGGDAANHVYVVAEEDGRLNIVGRIENIAPGEQLHSARFIGDRGFLVTFKKVDPLFTLDLSDPRAPVVKGELKVPGYSDYIHLLGQDHLLTIGKDAVDMGAYALYQGVQLSVFDVGDFSNPRQVDAEIVGDRGTESEALTEPHAFNYFEPARMLAVPMRILDDAGPDPWARGTWTFEGLCLFHVTPKDGITQIGRIST